MDTERLRHFACVVKLGSVREAAKYLHLSPGTVSKSIKILERELGMKLVEPAGRGISITDAGHEIARRAEAVLSELSELFRTPDKGGASTLRISAFGPFATYALGPLMRSVFAGRSLMLRHAWDTQLEQALLAGQVDVAVTLARRLSQHLSHHEAGQMELGLYAKETFLSVAFESLPFVVPALTTLGSPFDRQPIDGWPSSVPRNVQYEVVLLESALELCRQGLAVGYFPSFVVELHNRQVTANHRLARLTDIPHPAIHARQQVFVVTRRADAQHPAAQLLLQALPDICSLTN